MEKGSAEKWFIYIPSFVIGGIIFAAAVRGHINSNDINFDKLGGLGGFIGGLVGTSLTVFATLYVYKTYQSQKIELEEQRKLISQQQFETTFFNLLKVHADLKNSISFNYHKNGITRTISNMPNYLEEAINGYKYNPIVNGKDFFIAAHEDFKNLWAYEEGLFPLNFTIKEDYKIAHREYDYNSVFVDKNYKENYRDTKFKYELFFSNYGNNLGDYFRNLYHILKFISSEKAKFKMNNKGENKIEVDKYFNGYADILQSQMSFSELFLTFYNAVIFRKSRQYIREFNFLENLHATNLLNEFHTNIKCLGQIKNK